MSDLEDLLQRRRADRPSRRFLHVGSWIGSDRDGNPFVTADTLLHARHSAVAPRCFEHYLAETHELGAELQHEHDADRRPTTALRRARRGGAATPRRTASTNRTAAPSSASTPAWRQPRAGCGHRVRRPPSTAASRAVPPTAPPFSAISISSTPRCAAATAPASRRGRLRSLRHAVRIFGFHLAPLDLRQHSGVHEQVLAEILARAPASRPTTRRSTEPPRRRCCSASSRRRAYSLSPLRRLRRARRVGAGRSCAPRPTLQRRFGAAALRAPASSRRPAAPATCSRSPC